MFVLKSWKFMLRKTAEAEDSWQNSENDVKVTKDWCEGHKRLKALLLSIQFCSIISNPHSFGWYSLLKFLCFFFFFNLAGYGVYKFNMKRERGQQFPSLNSEKKIK